MYSNKIKKKSNQGKRPRAKDTPCSKLQFNPFSQQDATKSIHTLTLEDST
jgi:hypothetical protein